MNTYEIAAERAELIRRAAWLEARAELRLDEAQEALSEMRFEDFDECNARATDLNATARLLRHEAANL